MKNVHEFSEIYLHKAPVDGRRQINGLSAIVQASMGHSPFSGALFVFTSRRRDTVKLLYWNKSGFALWMHKLEKETFRWPRKMEGDTISLSPKELSWLLDGLDISRMKPHATLTFSSGF